MRNQSILTRSEVDRLIEMRVVEAMRAQMEIDCRAICQKCAAHAPLQLYPGLDDYYHPQPIDPADKWRTEIYVICPASNIRIAWSREHPGE